MMAPYVLQLQSVSLIRNERVLIDDVSATVEAGEIVILSGASGAGKSTLLRLINRLENPSHGQILFQGQDIREIPPTVLRQKIALVFQTPVLFPGSVLANFHLVEEIHDRPILPEAAYAEKLDWIGLPAAVLHQEANSLSVGEKQRFSVARALLNNPVILLLDEPTSALDPDASAHLLDALHDLHHHLEITILMVTHQKAHGERIGTRLWMMKNGALVEDTFIPHPPHPARMHP